MKYLAMAFIGLVMVGCTTKTVGFIESMHVEGQHEKAMKMLDSKYGEGLIVFKHTPEGLECMKKKMEDRGYYLFQDDIDCGKL